MKMTPMQRIERAHVSLIRDNEFMWLSGIIVMGNNTVTTEPGITARTDGANVEYGESFIADLTDAELMGLVLHEKLHCAFKHLTTWRTLYDNNHQLANMACDFVINLMIKDRADVDGFVRLPAGGCVDEQYRGMDTGQVFKLLKQQYPNGAPDSGFDQHDWDAASDLTAEEVEGLAKTIDQALRQGNILASKAGANVDRNVLEMLQPKVDWRDALREFVSNSKPGDEYTTYRRINRRFQSQDLMLPTSYSDSMYRVVLAVDTSGSIDNNAIAEFLAEAQSVCESVKPELVDLLYWGHDVAAHEQYEASAVGTLRESTKPKGGGGTAPSCVTTYLQDQNIRPDCIVMLTDGEVFGDWGGSWSAPVLWCISNTRINAPHGVTVHM